MARTRVTPDLQIARRVSSQAKFKDLRRKIHRLRRLVAGDITALNDGGHGQQSEMDELYRGDSQEFYDVLVTDVEAGRRNKLLQAIRTLIFQVSMVYPDVEFSDLDDDMSAVNSLYFKGVAQRCGLRDQMRMALADYAIGGFGCLYCGVRDGRPVVDWVDALDVTWDLTAPTFNQIKWGSRTIRLPLYQWMEMFPRAKPLQELTKGHDVDDDMPVSVQCYHDVTGEESGSEAYFMSNGDAEVSEDDLLWRGENLYRDHSAGYAQACVPLVFMHYLHLPSVKAPLSVAEMMLPAMIITWEADSYIRDSMVVGKPAREIEEGSYEEDSFEAWKSDPNAILVRRNGKAPMAVVGGTEVNQSTMAVLQTADQELTAQSGVSGYTLGTPVKGIQYASEVNAIQGSAGLVAGVVAKDSAECWQRVVKRSLANGLHDDQDFSMRYTSGNQQIELMFDAQDPVKNYLRPDADVIVAEDTLVYKPRDQRSAAAAADVQLASSVAQAFPQFLHHSLETYLRARGVKNVSEWLQSAPADTASQASATSAG